MGRKSQKKPPSKNYYQVNTSETGDHVMGSPLARTSGVMFCIERSDGITGACYATVNITGVGAVSANSLAPLAMTNAVGSIAQNNTWTPALTSYFSATTVAQFAAKSVNTCLCRDGEVTTWTRQGYVFFRLDGSGKAIYFFHNGETANGTLEIGIATGVTEAAYPGGSLPTNYILYQNTDCVGTITGYDRTDTTGDTFTFGVNGFDIYAKFNSVEFLRFKEYRHMATGAIAMKSQTGFGFRSFTFYPGNNAPLYSNYLAGEIDMRDWWARSLQTTGTIASSDTALTVASVDGLKVGDYVIVEIGAEAGAGARGTVGVGGTWPSANSSTTLALLGTTPSTDTFAWAQDTTEVWRYVSEALTSISSGSPLVVTIPSNFLSVNAIVSFETTGTLPAPLLPSSAGATYYVNSSGYTGTTFHISTSSSGTGINATSTGTGSHRLAWVQTIPYQEVAYYAHKALPRSLHGRISSIAGNILTLDTTSVSSATNANVYLDNQIFFNDVLQTPRTTPSLLASLTPSYLTVVVPSGSYAFGGIMHSLNHTGWTVRGEGQTNSFLTSPNGMRGCGFLFQAIPNVSIRDLTYSGNAGTSLYGLNYFDTVEPQAAGSQYDAYGRYLTTQSVGSVNEVSMGQDYFQTSELRLVLSDGAVVQDLTANKTFTNGVCFSNLSSGWAYRCTINHDFPTQSYTQWQFEFDNVSKGGAVDCVFNSCYVSQSFEAFGSTGVQFIRPTIRNGIFSLNQAGDILIQDATVTIDSCLSPPVEAGADGVNPGPIFSITGNAPGTYAPLGVTLDNVNITQTVYANADNDVLQGISITSHYDNVNVTGGSNIAPNYLGPSIYGGPVGLTCASTRGNILFDGFHACGILKSTTATTLSQCHVGAESGQVNNCITGGQIYLGPTATQTGNSTVGC